jgi:hypothetical protein
LEVSARFISLNYAHDRSKPITAHDNQSRRRAIPLQRIAVRQNRKTG